MAKINLLSAEISNKIAAGEVVERAGVRGEGAGGKQH